MTAVVCSWCFIGESCKSKSNILRRRIFVAIIQLESMALIEDSSLRMFLDYLLGTEEIFKSNFDEDVLNWLEALKSKISDLVLHPDSLRDSSGPTSNDHAEFSMAKHRILVQMEELYEKMEMDWFNNLARMKLEFLDKIKVFMQNTQLEVKLPKVLACLGANSDSSNSVYPYYPGSITQYRTNQESTPSSNLMPNTFQDTSRPLCHIKTEDVQHQAFTNSSLNYSKQQGPGTASNLMPSTFQDTSEHLCHIRTEQNTQPQASRSKAPSNEVISHSSVNISNAPCQNSTPFISNQSLSNLSLNETDQNFNAVSPSITYPVPQIQPELVLPVKKHVCSFCSQSFDHKSTLIEHMRKHSSEKPIICNECGGKFKRIGSLKTHKQKACKKQPPCATEDMQPQPSKRIRPNNEVISHSPVNTSNGPCQSSTPSTSNQSVTNWQTGTGGLFEREHSEKNNMFEKDNGRKSPSRV